MATAVSFQDMFVNSQNVIITSIRERENTLILSDIISDTILVSLFTRSNSELTGSVS